MEWLKPAKNGANALAGLLGLRVVNSEWGPRGVIRALTRAKKLGFSPRLIFDVGASNGQWTKACMKVFAEARYVLIDPLEENRKALVKFSKADPRITIWCGAAGSKVGTIELYEHGDQSSAFASEEFRGPVRAIDVNTIDALFEDGGRISPVLLKADVQGYEIEVLRGAEACLSSVEMLILEVSFRQIYAGSPLAHEVIEYVCNKGFRIYDICSYIQRRSDRELVQSDFIFVRESSSVFQYHGWK